MLQASSLLVNSELSLPIKDIATQSLMPTIIVMVIALGVMLIDPLTDNDKSASQRARVLFTEEGAMAFGLALSFGLSIGMVVFIVKIGMLITGVYNVIPIVIGLVVTLGLFVFRKKIASEIMALLHKMQHQHRELHR